MGYLDNFTGKPQVIEGTNKKLPEGGKKLAFAPKRKKKLAKYVEEKDGDIFSSQAAKDSMKTLSKLSP
jgi:hypothetical protein